VINKNGEKKAKDFGILESAKTKNWRPKK